MKGTLIALGLGDIAWMAYGASQIRRHPVIGWVLFIGGLFAAIMALVALRGIS